MQCVHVFCCWCAFQVLVPVGPCQPVEWPALRERRLRVPAGHGGSRDRQSPDRSQSAARRLRATDAVPVLHGRRVRASERRAAPLPLFQSVSVKHAWLYKHRWSVFIWKWWFDVESGMVKHAERTGMFFTRSYSIINGSLWLWFMPKVNVKLILALIGSLALHRPEKSISASAGVRACLFIAADVDVRSAAERRCLVF